VEQKAEIRKLSRETPKEDKPKEKLERAPYSSISTQSFRHVEFLGDQCDHWDSMRIFNNAGQRGTVGVAATSRGIKRPCDAISDSHRTARMSGSRAPGRL
jgi:hypothetical protein